MGERVYMYVPIAVHQSYVFLCILVEGKKATKKKSILEV